MTREAQEEFARRCAILRKLGAQIREVKCTDCGTVFVDPKPLGGRMWALVRLDPRARRADDGDRAPFCSESCATAALRRHRGAQAAWIEGYEPPERSNA